MRRWFSRKRPPARDPIAWDRCLLALETLETRENPAPFIFPPSLQISETPEDTGVSFQGSSSFSLFNSAAFGNVHRATLSVSSGTLTVAPQAGVTVTGNGTASVELTGLIGNINSVIFGGGFSYTPIGSFSGEASVGLTVTDLGVDESGNPTTPTGTATESFTLRVRPVASPAVVSVSASGEVRALSGPLPFAPGVLAVTGWPDADGSETATVTFSLDASDPAAFRLFNGPNELSPVEPGLWRVEATTAAELQAVFDSLALVPPPGFSGRATLSVSGSLVDSAEFPSLESTETTPPRDLVGGSIDLRFFLGTNVTLPQGLTAPEGGTFDLGGRFVGEDPDRLPGDVSVFTLSVPAGLLTFSDAALTAGMTADRTLNPDGSTTITLTGDLGAINAFLATAGGLVYSAPDPDFSGVLPLAVTLANRPGAAGGQQGGPPRGGQLTAGDDPTFAPLVIEPGPGEAPGKFGDVVPLLFTPEADDLFPIADDAVTTQDTPVEVFMGLAAPPADGSEAIVLIVNGVPDGAAFTAGTDLGNGLWALALSDLADLVFVPPPGAVGVFDLSVTAVVTDADPQSGMSDSATQTTTFTITVLPAGAPVVDDDADDTPTDDADDTDLTGGFFDDDFEDESDLGELDDGPVGDTADAEVSADPDGETDERPEELETEPAVLPEAIAGATPDASAAPGEGRGGLGAPGSGSLFARPEAPQPAYGGNEKHPLPPVLPLDQSSSAAGFTDSGGDSFALIDQLLRGTATAQADAPPAEPAAEPAKPGANAAPANDGPADEVAEADEWQYWVAGSALAGAATAWTLMSLERNGRLSRALRRPRRPARPEPVPAH